MPDNLQVTMLPAKEGDCLMVAYGKDLNRKYILIDAGRAWTYKKALKNYLKVNHITKLELLVITHVDRDHIDGMLELIKDTHLYLQVKNIWFNTYDHLRGRKIEIPQSEHDTEIFGAAMGEELSKEIIRKGWPWNRQFSSKAVELDNNAAENTLEFDDMKLVLLSPDRDKLEALQPDWERECQEAGIAPGSTVEDYEIVDDDMEEFGPIDIDALAEEVFTEDSSSANGSSIAFILEYKNRKILLSGDAHPDLLVKSLKNMGSSASHPLKVDAFKVPHHGSKYNISKELLRMIQCDHYLVATNGNYFKHPEKVAMARIIKYGTPDSAISFNYKTDYTRIWANNNWQQKYRYCTNYPKTGQDGYLSLDW